MIESKHTLSYCTMCGDMVLCADCGNNCCNGASGNSFGKNCDCSEAYAHQAAYWKDHNSVKFAKDDRKEPDKSPPTPEQAQQAINDWVSSTKVKPGE